MQSKDQAVVEIEQELNDHKAIVRGTRPFGRVWSHHYTTLVLSEYCGFNVYYIVDRSSGGSNRFGVGSGNFNDHARNHQAVHKYDGGHVYELHTSVLPWMAKRR